MAGSPRIIARPTTRSPAACRRARVRQGQAFGGAEEAPSLTVAARDGDGNMRSGRKNARGAGRTKQWNHKGRQKWRGLLDKQSPIQAESDFLSQDSLGSPEPIMTAEYRSPPDYAHQATLPIKLWQTAGGRLRSSHR